MRVRWARISVWAALRASSALSARSRQVASRSSSIQVGECPGAAVSGLGVVVKEGARDVRATSDGGDTDPAPSHAGGGRSPSGPAGGPSRSCGGGPPRQLRFGEEGGLHATCCSGQCPRLHTYRCTRPRGRGGKGWPVAFCAARLWPVAHSAREGDPCGAFPARLHHRAPGGYDRNPRGRVLVPEGGPAQGTRPGRPDRDAGRRPGRTAGRAMARA